MPAARWIPAYIAELPGGTTKFRITENRGKVLDWAGFALVPTIHPSAVLRMEPDERDAGLDALVDDLRVVAAVRGRQT